MAIPCKDLTLHRSSWVLLNRDWCRFSSTDPGYSTPGRHTVSCPFCGVAWRSAAQYARGLPLRGKIYLTKTEKRIHELVADYPLLAELTYRPNTKTVWGNLFLNDVAAKFLQYGRLTNRQIEAVENTLFYLMREETKREQAIEAKRRYRAHLEALEASMRAQMEALGESLAPEGAQVVVGTVEKVWTPERHADALEAPLPKMLLRADQGFTVEVSVPKVLREALKLSRLVGRRVELHARLRRQSDDWTAAWGSNPLQKTSLLPSNAALL